MKARPFFVESDSGKSHYTDLFVSISEDEDGYTLQVRLCDEMRPEDAAWGEEVAQTVETAALLISALAAEFSIPQARTKIKIWMNNVTRGTRH